MASEMGSFLKLVSNVEGCSVDKNPSQITPDDFENVYGVVLPPDLKEFWSICSGIHFFEEAEYPVHILGIDAAKRANVVIRGVEGEGHPSYHWFLIADLENGNHLTIDLAPERLGRCYESFWETHSFVGQSPVVATGFSDLLKRALQNRGKYFWWLDDSFEGLGDAYDDL